MVRLIRFFLRRSRAVDLHVQLVELESAQSFRCPRFCITIGLSLPPFRLNVLPQFNFNLYQAVFQEQRQKNFKKRCDRPVGRAVSDLSSYGASDRRCVSR